MASKEIINSERVVEMQNGSCDVAYNGETGSFHTKEGSHIPKEDRDGCVCQVCSQRYYVDLIIDDTIWNRIRPEGKAPGAGLLCPNCMCDRLATLRPGDTSASIKCGGGGALQSNRGVKVFTDPDGRSYYFDENYNKVYEAVNIEEEPQEEQPCKVIGPEEAREIYRDNREQGERVRRKTSKDGVNY